MNKVNTSMVYYYIKDPTITVPLEVITIEQALIVINYVYMKIVSILHPEIIVPSLDAHTTNSIKMIKIIPSSMQKMMIIDKHSKYYQPDKHPSIAITPKIHNIIKKNKSHKPAIPQNLLAPWMDISKH
jgi:hypothetical protein